MFNMEIYQGTQHAGVLAQVFLYNEMLHITTTYNII